MVSRKRVAPVEEVAKAVMDHSNRVSIENAISPLKESMDDKLNTLNQSVTHLKDEVGSLKAELTAIKDQLLVQGKHQILEWALENCSSGAFQCRSAAFGCPSATVPMKDILLAFRHNRGCSIHGCYLDSQNESGYAKYHRALEKQIDQLIGHKPRIVKDKDGKWVIYYK